MRLSHRGGTEPALATILSVHDHAVAAVIDGNAYTDGGRTPWRERIRVRVKPEGRAEFESEATVRHHSSFACEARDTYVLYDPEHPERCDIDYDRLEKEFGLTNLSCFPSPSDGVSALHDVPTSVPQSPEPAAESSSNQGEAPVDADPTLDQIARLDELHRSGTLTDAEFAELKSRVIGRDADPG
jgi:hypothetical protein